MYLLVSYCMLTFRIAIAGFSTQAALFPTFYMYLCMNVHACVILHTHFFTSPSQEFSAQATACLGPSPGFGPAWAHGSGLNSGEPKPLQAEPKPGL